MGQSSGSEEEFILLTKKEKKKVENSESVHKLINGIVQNSDVDGEEMDEQFRHVPIIKNRYRVLGVLGSGAFGNVLKIKDLQSNQTLALKSISLSMGRDSEDENQNMKKHVIKSAETELKVLPRLNHPNIVRYETSFLNHKNPLSYSGGSTHLCLLMEYVHGSDLDTVLSHVEEKKLEIPKAVTVKWFVKLIDTLKYIHDRGIIHRDLKPDNILLHYTNVNDVHSMNLKISDFGVSKDIEREGKGKEISGHVFFCSPEVLKKQEYDSKIDIWSLAIIFLQVFYGISLSTYQEIIEKLIFEVKEREDYSNEFVKMFGKQDMYDGVTYVEVLDFLHTKGLFYQHVFEKFMKEDDAISFVLNKMICCVEDRWYAKDIVECNVYKTWQYLLCTEDIPRGSISDMSFLDVTAVMTVIDILNDEPDVYERCIDSLMDILDRDSNALSYLLKRKVFEKVTHKVMLFSHNEDTVIRFFHFILKCMMTGFSQCFLKISVLLRKHYLIDILRRLILNLNDPKLYFLTLLLVRNNSTIRVLFKDIVLSMFLKFIAEKDKEILLHLLKVLIPLVDTKADLLKIFSIYKYDNVLFFRKNIAFGDDEELLQKLVDRIMNRIKFFVLRPLDPNFKEEVLDNLLMLLFIVGEEPEKRHQIQISIDYEHSWVCHNSLQVLSRSKKEIENIEMGGEFEFTCINGDESTESDLISNHPIAQVTPLKKEEEEKEGDELVVGYYEMFVLDGGSNDNIEVGVISNTHKCYLLDCTNGFIHISDEENDHIIMYKDLPACSNTYIGVGITDKNQLFYTYNNMIIRPFLNLSESLFTEEEKIGNKPIQLFAFMRVGGNEFFSGMINFGQHPFDFNFANEQEKIMSIKPLEYIESNENFKMNEHLIKLQELRKKQHDYDEVDDIILAASETLRRMVTTKDPYVYEEKVVRFFEKEEKSFDKLFKLYPDLRFDDSDQKKERKNVSDIIYGFNKARNLKRIARVIKEEEMEEEEGEEEEKKIEEVPITTASEPLIIVEKKVAPKEVEVQQQPPTPVVVDPKKVDVDGGNGKEDLPPSVLKIREMKLQKRSMSLSPSDLVSQLRRRQEGKLHHHGKEEARIINRENRTKLLKENKPQSSGTRRKSLLNDDEREELEIKEELERLRGNERPVMNKEKLKQSRPTIHRMLKQKMRARVAVQSLPVGFSKNGLEKKLAFQQLLERKRNWRISIGKGELKTPKRTAPTLPGDKHEQEEQEQELEKKQENVRRFHRLSVPAGVKFKPPPTRKAPPPVFQPPLEEEQQQQQGEKEEGYVNDELEKIQREEELLLEEEEALLVEEEEYVEEELEDEVLTDEEIEEEFLDEIPLENSDMMETPSQQENEIHTPHVNVKKVENSQKTRTVPTVKRAKPPGRIPKDVKQRIGVPKKLAGTTTTPKKKKEEGGRTGPAQFRLSLRTTRGRAGNTGRGGTKNVGRVKSTSVNSGSASPGSRIAQLKNQYLQNFNEKKAGRRQSLPVQGRSPVKTTTSTKGGKGAQRIIDQSKQKNRLSLNLAPGKRPRRPPNKNGKPSSTVPVVKGRDRRASATGAAYQKKKERRRRKIVSEPPPLPGKKGRPVLSQIHETLARRKKLKTTAEIMTQFSAFHFE